MTIFILLALAFSDPAPKWQVQNGSMDTNLRGVSVSQVRGGKYVVWASGSKGTVLRSLDEGKSWKQLKVEGGADLDFRDVEGFGPATAYVMSSGDGEKSRIYKTTDGGTSWTLQYTDKRPGFFLDSLACDSKTHCFALSDPVDGKFLVLSTSDGEHWKELPRDKMPAALPTEPAFAASGTAIALCHHKDIYFGTGGPSTRVFHSGDRGRSWTAVATPLASGNPSSGIFSLAEDQPGGYRSGVVFLSHDDFAAIGPNGTDITHDAGVHWTRMETLNLNAVSYAATQGWAVGPKGTIARFTPRLP
jgi:photosystem II stability/assembly factor-like uncharacterized protein